MRNQRMTFVGFLMTLGVAGGVSAQTALESVETAPARSGPGTGYAVLGRIPAGQGYVGTEFVRSVAGDLWWRFYYNGKKLWTRCDHWKTVAGTTGVKVQRDSMILRSGPATTYAIAGQVYRGQIYRWSSTSAGWYRIWCGGKVCWILGSGVDKVRLAGVTGPANATAADVDLTPYWKKQETNYWCGPATLQMMTRYMTGLYYRQSYLANWLGTTSHGTLTSREHEGLARFTGKFFHYASYKRSLILSNIRRSAPVVIRFNLRYIAYDSGSTANHFSAVRGYTPDGYYIADVYYGPRKWATSTQLYNATHYISGDPGCSLQVRFQD